MNLVPDNTVQHILSVSATIKNMFTSNQFQTLFHLNTFILDCWQTHWFLFVLEVLCKQEKICLKINKSLLGTTMRYLNTHKECVRCVSEIGWIMEYLVQMNRTEQNVSMIQSLSEQHNYIWWKSTGKSNLKLLLCLLLILISVVYIYVILIYFSLVVKHAILLM